MKRLKLVIVILLMLPLTGCVEKNTATDVQTNAVAEYMAGLLLEYDNHYDQALIPEDEINKSGESKVTQTPVPSASADGNQSEQSGNITAGAQNLSNINDVIAKKNFDIKYESYQIADTYPKNSDNALFVLKHSKGYKLLVINFKIKNKADSTKKLNLVNNDIKYQLSIGKNNQYKPLLSLLENNLQYLDLKIGKGKSKRGILIFEVPENIDTSDMSLSVSKNDQSATVKLK